MNDRAPALSRSRTTPALAPPAVGQANLDLELNRANVIAKAGDAVPKGYRGNPGAVLLALEWAGRHGMTVLEAMQAVAFVHGRPVVDATAQRALAERAGYRVTPTEITSTSCTVTVSVDGEVLGAATYTLDDAKRAKLLGKDNWQTSPEDMLVARATGRAVRRFAPGVLFGLSTIDEIEAPLLEPPPTLATTLERDRVQLEQRDAVEVHEIEGTGDAGVSVDAVTVQADPVPSPAVETSGQPENDGSLGPDGPAAPEVDLEGTTRPQPPRSQADAISRPRMRGEIRAMITRLDAPAKGRLTKWMNGKGWKLDALEVPDLADVQAYVVAMLPVDEQLDLEG